jgi:hypothetical protein
MSQPQRNVFRSWERVLRRHRAHEHLPLIAGILHRAFVAVAYAVLADGGRARYSSEFGESVGTFDPNATFSQASAPRRRDFGLYLTNEFTESPGMRRWSSGGGGHVTDDKELPRNMFSGDGTNTRHVFERIVRCEYGEGENLHTRTHLNGICRC